MDTWERRLGLTPGERVALVGSGGKTTLFWELGREYRGRKLLLTTTTKMGPPPAPFPQCLPEELPERWADSRSLYVGRQEGHKVTGPTREQLDAWDLPGLELMVVEADGSRGRPIKAHAHYEPVVPRTATLVVAVLGMRSLGMLATEGHRPELLCPLLGHEGPLSENDLLRVLECYLQVAPAPRQAVLFNQADDERLQAAAARIGERLRVPYAVRGQDLAGASPQDGR